VDKEKKRRLAYEIMIVFGVLILLALITRIWPLVLLLFLAIIICALRMLFLSFNKVEPIKPTASHMPPPQPETEQTLINKAFGLFQTRITEKVMERFPGARWIWMTPNPIESFAHGDMLVISLNGANGYRKATIRYHNLMFCGLDFEGSDRPVESPTPVNPEDDPDYDPDYQDEESNKETESEAGSEDHEDSPFPEPPVNYERLAFDWVESHMYMLNEKANESLAAEKKEVMFSGEELPNPDSWPAVCSELTRNGFATAELVEDGILAILP